MAICEKHPQEHRQAQKNAVDRAQSSASMKHKDAHGDCDCIVTGWVNLVPCPLCFLVENERAADLESWARQNAKNILSQLRALAVITHAAAGRAKDEMSSAIFRRLNEETTALLNSAPKDSSCPKPEGA